MPDRTPADAAPMATSPPSRRQVLNVGLLVLLVGMLTLATLGQWFRGYLVKTEKNRFHPRVEVYGHRLEHELTDRLALLKGLRAFIQHHLEEDAFDPQAFSSYVGFLLLETSGVRGVALDRGGALRTIDAPGRAQDWPDLERLAASPEGTPAKLGPGADTPRLSAAGNGLIARLAIRHGHQPWGELILSLDTAVILRSAGLEDVEPDLQLALQDGSGQLLAGEPGVLSADPVFVAIPASGLNWRLLGIPAAGWNHRITSDLLFFWLAGLTVTLCLALLTALLYRHEMKLAAQVAERTAALDQELAIRHQALQELQRERRTLQAFLDALPEAALLMNPDGRVLVCNQIVRDRYDIAPEDPGRDNLLQALPVESALDRKQLIDEVVRTGQPARFVIELPDRTVANYLHPVSRESGQVRQLAQIGIDISRLTELDRQLRQVQKMEAIGTLSAGVSHEFNNILTAIIGQASLLEMKLPAETPLLNSVRQILGAADRGEKLTRALLTFSRRQRSEPETLDLNLLVQRLEKILTPLLGIKNRIVITLAPTELLVNVDAGQIEQVLLSLALNARDAMPGGGEIQIATDQTFLDQHGDHPSGHYARLIFRDSGTGMDKELISRIFEPFFTTKEVGRGTGLGLSVALGIMQQSRGILTCDSIPGAGTTFTLYFPLIASGLQREAAARKEC